MSSQTDDDGPKLKDCIYKRSSYILCQANILHTNKMSKNHPLRKIVHPFVAFTKTGEAVKCERIPH